MGLHPLWVTKDGPGGKAAILFEVIKKSNRDGLFPEEYQSNRIASLWKGTTAEELIELDSLLTLALIRYAHDAQKGRARTGAEKSPSLQLAQNEGLPVFDALTLTQDALLSNDLNQFLENLLPRHKYYRNLRDALPRYRQLDATGGWRQTAFGKSIHPGEQDARIPAIRTRLQMEGFLPSTSAGTSVYDPELAQAVSLFQTLHGLTGDGVIGKSTIAAMNITAEQKVRQIILNLERWRWEAHTLGQKYVLVDIAGFTLEAIENDTLILEMPVVVGMQEHETPVFSDIIQYVEIHPFWHVPAKIARDEMLEELRKNPHYLNKQHIRLFSDRTSEAEELNPLAMDWKQVSPQQMGRFKLRQDPGKWNALGAIKIAFPNSLNVYMHDTPSQSYFKRTSRAFSHGCIRLSNPRQLALFLLGGVEKGWTMERLDDIIAADKRSILRLPSPLPVHITYQTVKSDESGRVSFHRDIYNRDPQLAEILFTK
jgi:murein L,D-transpeptidase YcbB/YkuD